MSPSARATSCLYGIAAVAMLWMLAMFSATAFAQEPLAQHWDRATAATLLTYIERIGSHGLKPADYAPALLRQAIDTGDEAMLEKEADESFARVAQDLAEGRVPADQRARYYIPANSLEPAQVARMIDVAIAAHQVSAVLDTFAPQNAEYAALRKALAGPDGADPLKRRQLEATLERWRWFPRNPGSRYLAVNIPEFRLRLIEDGKEIDNHKVIVGKSEKPTPQFETRVIGVILNPSWVVPQSILPEGIGRLVRTQPTTARSRGYTWLSRAGHLTVTQQPGPTNSLGQMKLDMPNPFTVYIHDTPGKSLFDTDDRAYSHGCMRMQNPFDLAQKLLADVGWDRARIDAVVASRVTTRIALSRPLPVYVMYMTAVPRADGSIAYLKDPYGLDAALAAKLD